MSEIASAMLPQQTAGRRKKEQVRSNDWCNASANSGTSDSRPHLYLMVTRQLHMVSSNGRSSI